MSPVIYTEYVICFHKIMAVSVLLMTVKAKLYKAPIICSNCLATYGSMAALGVGGG